MKWLTRLWLRKQTVSTLTQKQKEDALKILSTSPVREYLVALVSELVREGIYLTAAQQEGARFTVDLITKEIQKGDALFKK